MRAALALVAALVSLAHAETRPRYGGAVEAGLLGAPVALDPVAAQTSSELTVVGLVFDTLYTIGPDGAVQPHLAIGAPALDAARNVVHVALRKGVTFHDGAPLTASDVADSLERVHGRLAWLLAPVATIRVAGDGIDLALRAPGADVAALLALPQTAITRRGEPPGARPVGSGPFAVERFDRAARTLALRAFDNHFAGRPYLDRLQLRWDDTPDGEARRFETGAAQLSARGAAAFAGARPKYPASQVESPASLLLYIGFGRHNAAITGERAFRKALDLAIDRGALAGITTGEHTQPTRLPLPIEAGAPLLDAAGRAGDAAAAQAILAEAARRSPALARLATTHLTILFDTTRPDDREVALRVSRALERLGLGATTIEAVTAERLRAARDDCDLYIGQLAAPITVAAAWWGPAFAAGNDDWAQLRLASGALDPVATAREFAARLPIVPLMFRSLLIWHRSDVHGLGFDASARPSLADLFWLKGRP